MRYVLVCGFYAALCSVSAAQTIYDNCGKLISEGLREYDIEHTSGSYLDTVHDRYCDASGSTNSSNASIGLDLVVKAIPINFTGNYGSYEEAMRNFCKDYKSTRAAATESRSRKEKIVSRAYQSFDACISLAAAGVFINQTVESVSRVNFYVSPSINRSVVISGINSTSNVSCQGQDPNNRGAASVTFNTDSMIKLTTAPLGMVCTRSGVLDKSGNTNFDEAVITVLTDINPNGNYTIYMPRATYLAENEAERVRTQLVDMEKALEALRAELLKVPGLVAKSDEGDAHTLNFYGSQTVWDEGYSCPAGQYLAGLTAHVLQPHTVLSGGNDEDKIRTFSNLRLNCRRFGGTP